MNAAASFAVGVRPADLSDARDQSLIDNYVAEHPDAAGGASQSPYAPELEG